MGCTSSTVAAAASASAPVEDEQAKMYRLRAEESAKRLLEMQQEIEVERERETAALGEASSALFVALQRQWYGVTIQLPPEQFQQYLHATCSVAATDKRRFSQQASERAWLQDRMLLLGLKQEQRDRLFTLDFHLDAVEPVVEKLTSSYASTPLRQVLRRVLYYDALTMAMLESFSLDDTLRASRVAEMLKLSESMRDQIKSLVEEESELRRRKQDLFARPDENAPQQNGGLMSLFSGLGTASSEPEPDEAELASRPRRLALHRLTYAAPVPLVEQRNKTYPISLLAVASAEGNVSTAEREWLQDRCTVLELDSKLFAPFFAAIGPDGKLKSESAPLAELQTAQRAEDNSVARAVLYDATTMAAHEGLTDAKIARARGVAERLGLSTELCDEVLAIVAEETRLRQLKGQLFDSNLNSNDGMGA